MRKIFNSFMLISMIGLFFGSCTVEKRLYNKGYYVQWNHSYKGGQEVSAEIAEGNSDALQNEVKQTNAVSSEETIVLNDETKSEVINDAVVTSTENNPAVLEKETETKIEKNNSAETNFVTTLGPVRIKSKADKFTLPVIRKVSKKAESNSAGPDRALLMVLCFFIPWLAVGLATDWELKPLIFNLLWSLTCIGGIIHGLVVVSREA